MKISLVHTPVLLKEVIDSLHIKNQARYPKGKYIDTTLGLGGHSVEILKKGGILLGIDADKNMLNIAERRLMEACPDSQNSNLRVPPYTLIQGNFANIGNIASELGFTNVSGIIMDLGISMLHYKDLARGFSFQDPSVSLDMRLDNVSQAVKASDLLNLLREDQLINLFSVILSGFESRKLAKAVVGKRQVTPFNTVGDLVEICERVLSKKVTHPATKAFLALRIAVNSELENISVGLPQAIELLEKGGRLAVITFHSGEDKLVKEIFKSQIKKNLIKEVNKKPIVPSLSEIKENQSARSAKLRVVEKI